MKDTRLPEEIAVDDEREALADARAEHHNKAVDAAGGGFVSMDAMLAGAQSYEARLLARSIRARGKDTTE